MKKIISIILTIGLVFGFSGFYTDNSYAATPKIVLELDVHAGHVTTDHISRGHSINMVAKLYDESGKLVTGTPSAMHWNITHVDGSADHQAYVSSGKVSDYEGLGEISHAYIYVPYTEHASAIRLHVSSAVFPGVSEAKMDFKITNSKYEDHHTFFYYLKGHNDVTGNSPKVKETWNHDAQTYTTTVAKNTFKRKGYKFKYWIDHYGKKYKPGDTITMDRKKHGELKAVWTKKTYKKISLVKAKLKSKTTIKLTWGKVEDAAGYNIFRYDYDKQKYIKIKKINKGNTTSWTNKNLKAGVKYKYKVQAVKNINGKKVKQKKSYWVNASTSAYRGNVTKITLSKKKINLKVGKKTTLVAKIKTKGNKTATSENIRWYSTDKNVAKVSKSGKITAKSKGTCYVYAKGHNGKNSKKTMVTVK